jgi:excisionase family DNA binding protein
MASIHPGATGSAAEVEPLVVSPRQACLLLSIGNTRLYSLIGAGELESYLDGRSRRITMASIRRRLAKLLSAEGATGVTTEATSPRRPCGRHERAKSLKPSTRREATA